MAASAFNNAIPVDDDHGRPGFHVGLIGRGIQLSRTPKMHVEEGAALGLDYHYELFDTKNLPSDDKLIDILDRVEGEGYCGVNITHPFKRTVIPFVDHLSESANAVGAVNTVVFQKGKRFGHNTDYWGFSEAVRNNNQGVSDKRVLLVGAGGAGCAVANALIDLGVKKLAIYDNNHSSSAELINRLTSRSAGERVLRADNLSDEILKSDGIINATPVGMSTMPGSPVPVELLRKNHWVVDIIYFPLETKLLASARERGCLTMDGSGMAIFQAARAFELFTGLKPNPNRMRATFDAFIHNPAGMPGS